MFSDTSIKKSLAEKKSILKFVNYYSFLLEFK